MFCLSVFSNNDGLERHMQVFHHWIRYPKTLKKCFFCLSFLDTDSSAVPDEMLEKLIASRNANTGVFNLRQVSYIVVWHDPVSY